jgi:hypothetical protein
MRRTYQHAEPSCPVADGDVPTCTTGPFGQLRFVARELADIAHGLLNAAHGHHEHSTSGERGAPKGDSDGSTTRRYGGTTP